MGRLQATIGGTVLFDTQDSLFKKYGISIWNSHALIIQTPFHTISFNARIRRWSYVEKANTRLFDLGRNNWPKKNKLSN